MSSLLQPTHIEQYYKALVKICKTDCQIMDTVQETERVRQMIGTEEEFSAKMSADPMYQQMVALILRRGQRVKRKRGVRRKREVRRKLNFDL
jgi:hypothetical protein